MGGSVTASESPIYFMSHLHNQGGVKWLYCKNDLGLPFTEFNKRSAVLFSYSTFLPCHTPFCFCGANAGYTHITESRHSPGARNLRRHVPSSCSAMGTQRRQLSQVPKLAVKNCVQPGCTLVVGSHERWLLICLFFHQLRGQPACKGRSPIPLPSSSPRRI